MVSQEICQDGRVLPLFKSKFLNKFNNVDKNLVIDLSNKLSLLDKEYKKLDENKLTVYKREKSIGEKLRKK